MWSRPMQRISGRRFGLSTWPSSIPIQRSSIRLQYYCAPPFSCSSPSGFSCTHSGCLISSWAGSGSLAPWSGHRIVQVGSQVLGGRVSDIRSSGSSSCLRGGCSTFPPGGGVEGCPWAINRRRSFAVAAAKPGCWWGHGKTAKPSGNMPRRHERQLKAYPPWGLPPTMKGVVQGAAGAFPAGPGE
jgi:hypothetical protein